MPGILDLLADAATERATLRTIPGPAEPVTLAQVWRRSADAGRYLAHRAGRGSAVAMMLTTSADCVTALIGGWRAGLCIASLPTPARAVPMPEYAQQIGAVLRLMEAKLLVVDDEVASAIPELPVPVVTFSQTLSGWGAKTADEAGSFVQFTSGSTSTPKGVRLSMEAIGENVRALLDGVASPDPLVSCSWLPLSHDMGLVGMFLAAWAGQRHVSPGGLVLIRPERFLRRPSTWLSACAQFGATVTAAPNFGLELALRDLAGCASLDLSALRVCIVGAEPVRAETLRRFAKELAPLRFDSDALCPAYGMAEASLAVSAKPPGKPWNSCHVDTSALEMGRWQESGPGEGTTELVGLGAPLPGIEVAVGGEPAAVGEVLVRGSSMFDGYLGGADPRGADRWFPTRDLGMLRDGELYVTGRADEVLLVAGRNLYPHDVEEAAARVGGVRRHCTAAVAYGPSDYAIVLERPGKLVAEEELKRLCRAVRLEVAKRIGIGPAAVIVIARGSFPRTPSGKPQRRRLAAQVALPDAALELAMHFG
ncbi:long-chain-fatty-acid--CoA ligase [Rhizocola hellebori]|uniref:Long-chain-fatty-acid--CoA ligase n=1 Tax=Rhizocola hellebori TaxID=1392758 RepID=A0A8J3VGB6_9ACTN|nr:AMP-binding protein [Rhizocola hellebori]GIH04901.1 long-chain-fatty-acid--CoA ligase [Rhizocola hellebori]